MGNNTHNHNTNQRMIGRKGQSLLEFALLIPILLLFVFGALDLGRAFFSVVVIQNATRAGAREGITLSNNNPTARNTRIVQMTIQEAQGGGIAITNAMVAVTCPHPEPLINGGCTRSDPLRVTVAYPFTLTLNWLLPVSMTFERYTEMMVP
jgi:Flp pilus assembly protein TadG